MDDLKALIRALPENCMDDIEQADIECNLRGFVYWLNQLKDNQCTQTAVIKAVGEQTVKNAEEICKLWAEVDKIYDKIDDLQDQIDAINQLIVELDISAIREDINVLAGKLSWFTQHLPAAQGLIPDSWKFAMGTISLLSNNGTTLPTDVTAYGIFTSPHLHDNGDVYAD